MSDWDELEGQESKPRLQQMAEEYEQTKKQYAALKERLDDLQMRIAAETPEEFGEHAIEAGDVTIVVKRNDRYAWDQDYLAECMTDMQGEIPDFVKQAFTIDKKQFNAASDDMRKPFLNALTRKQGTINITIKRNA